MGKLLIQKCCLGDKSICIQMNTISCLFRMQIQERRCLTSMRVCLCGGRCLAAQAERHASATQDAQLSTLKTKRKRVWAIRPGQEVSQAHPWRDADPRGELFTSDLSLRCSHLNTTGGKAVCASHLEYNYRPWLWGGMVEVNGANPRVEDAVSNSSIRNQNIKRQH